MLHSNIARKKITLGLSFFFEGACVDIIVDGIGVMAQPSFWPLNAVELPLT